MTEENRVTPELLQSLVVDEQYYRFPETTVTICCLTLKNGFNAVGESACVDEDLFDEGVGRKMAYAKAMDGMWGREGYLMKQRMYDAEGV